jgi:hypothetical protein
MKGTYIGAIKPLSLFFVKLGGSFSLITHNTNMSNVQTKHSSVGFFLVEPTTYLMGVLYLQLITFLMVRDIPVDGEPPVVLSWISRSSSSLLLVIIYIGVRCTCVCSWDVSNGTYI